MAVTRTSLSDDDAKILREIGARIREAREKAGLNQSELAERSGLTRSWIGRLEAGSNAPTVLALIHISAELGVTVSALTRGIKSPPWRRRSDIAGE